MVSGPKQTVVQPPANGCMFIGNGTQIVNMLMFAIRGRASKIMVRHKDGFTALADSASMVVAEAQSRRVSFLEMDSRAAISFINKRISL